MIRKLPRTYQLGQSLQKIVDDNQPFKPGDWNKSIFEAVKKEIREQLHSIQDGDCAYCGLKVNETGRAEIDHVANKGGKKRHSHYYFSFEPLNLVLACQYCNSSTKKGQREVVTHIDTSDYNNCEFSIVHPHRDDPSEHYDLSGSKHQILISSKSDKGKMSIEIFELDSEAHTMARAKQKMYELSLAKNKRKDEILARVFKILRFK